MQNRRFGPAAGRSRREFVCSGIAVALAYATGACTRPAVSRDLARWSRTLRGRVLSPDSPGYDDARRVWNTAVDRRPLALVRCADLDDVRRCVDFARRGGIPIAVRGGGHSYAGHSVLDGAIQIDLGDMRAVAVDAEALRASAAGGARIRDLLAPALAVGLYTPMGGCGDVGVAGLALAGGDTRGMGLRGTASDNVIGAQLVTADGDLVDVGPGRHDDLYWAIRGGGGNFGVVTRLEFRLYPVRAETGAYWRIPLANGREALRSFRDLIRGAPDALQAAFGVESTEGAWAYCSQEGAPAEVESTLRTWRVAFRPVEPQVRTSTPDPAGVVIPPSAFAADAVFLADLPDAAIDDLMSSAEHAPPKASIYLVTSRGAVARIGAEDTAYSLRGAGIHVSASAPWTTPADRGRAEEWIASFGAFIRPHGRLAYVNYLSGASVDRVREAYGVNYERLQRVKGRYDPANLFRSNHNIPPRA